MTDERQEKISPIAVVARDGAEERTVDLTTIDKKQYNVLVPTEKVKMISPYHMARVQFVTLSAEPQDGDVYKSGWENGAAVYAPKKPGLLKLSDAAGIIWHTPECKRMDNMSDRNYVSFQAVGGIRLPDGTFKAFKGNYEIDMEVIEAQIRMDWEAKIGTSIGYGDKKHQCTAEEAEKNIQRDTLQFRRYKVGRCETGAYLRVVRALLRLKPGFTADELSRPFVVARIDFAPDYNDPRIRKTMELAMLSQMSSDFGDGKTTVEMREAEAEFHDMKKLPEPDWTGGAVEGGEAEEIGDVQDLDDHGFDEPIEGEFEEGGEPEQAPAEPLKAPGNPDLLATAAQKQKLALMFKDCGYNDQGEDEWLREHFRKTSKSELTKSEASSAIEMLDEELNK